jgi:dTDP-4-dehydrorhamnose reductase
MTVLVLGSTGLLGQAIMAEAARRGVKAIGAARRGAEFSLDIENPEAISKAFVELKPSMVLNAAALTNIDVCEKDPGLAYRVNARAVSLLAEACRFHDAKLCHVSTEHYFTGDGKARHDEQAPVRLINEYARSKYAGEAFALTAPNALVARVNIVGWRGWKDQPTYVEWAMDVLSNHKPFKLFFDVFTSPLDVRACAGGLFDLCDKGASGIVNLGGREVSSKGEFITALAKGLNINPDWAEKGSVKELAALRAESLGLDVTLAEKLLGYRLATTQEVVAALLNSRPKA